MIVDFRLPFLSEGQASLFKFWLDGDIREGLSYDGELFCHSYTFTKQETDKIYTLGHNLMQEGVEVVVTSAGDRYRLWTSLRG